MYRDNHPFLTEFCKNLTFKIEILINLFSNLKNIFLERRVDLDSLI